MLGPWEGFLPVSRTVSSLKGKKLLDGTYIVLIT